MRAPNSTSTMRLRLEFPDKYRLWSELLRARTDRVFIGSSFMPKLGVETAVELVVGTVTVMAFGRVVGLRRQSARFRAGVWVRFDEEEIEKVRRFLGLTQEPDKSPMGRRFRRYACTLNVLFKRPSLPNTAVARNLS